MKLREMIDKLEDFDMVLFPYENERGITIKDVLRGDRAEECGNCEAAKNSDAAENIAVIIGSEGGFSDQDRRRGRYLSFSGENGPQDRDRGDGRYSYDNV